MNLLKKIYLLIIILIALVVIFFIVRYKKRVVNISQIKYFHFGYSTGNMMYANVTYDLSLKDDGYVVVIKPSGISEEDAYEVSISNSDVKKIEDILKKYEVGKWNEFHKSDSNVLDGNSFSLSIGFVNDDYISASGYMKWPKNYKDVRGELDSFFMNFYNEKED